MRIRSSRMLSTAADASNTEARNLLRKGTILLFAIDSANVATAPVRRILQSHTGSMPVRIRDKEIRVKANGRQPEPTLCVERGCGRERFAGGTGNG
jgi:hypothetical protein